MAAAGVVLAGGQSRRMGRDKAMLPWGTSTLLGTVVDVLTRSVDGPVVVVRDPGRELPPLPPGVEVVADPVADLGPVQGVAAGLRAIAGRATTAFVASTDLPLLAPSVVRRVLELHGDGRHAVTVPVVHDFEHLLVAAYSCRVADTFDTALAAGERRLRTVVGGVAVRRVEAAELLADEAVRTEDPRLESFTNLNDQQAYERALAAHRG